MNNWKDGQTDGRTGGQLCRHIKGKGDREKDGRTGRQVNKTDRSSIYYFKRELMKVVEANFLECPGSLQSTGSVG
jgi:hypothetical protein